MRMSFKKIICIVLSAAILITTINLSAIPVSAISTVRISLDPIPNEVYVPSGDFEMDILSDVMEEPNYNIITNNRKNDWGRLHSYDHLAYSEIHRRVQNDIKNNLQNHISGLELKLDYTDVSDDKFRSNKAGTYGRADIYYANELTRVMYLWEVKPSSYRDTNKSKGLKQIDRYVNNGYSELYSNFDFDYGSNSPGSINNRQFQFHLSLDCAEGTESWIEDVTYTVNYETIEFGLIIYDFIRNSTKTKKQKDEKTNSEAESGSNENTGDNTSSQDSESSNDKSKKMETLLFRSCFRGGFFLEEATVIPAPATT